MLNKAQIIGNLGADPEVKETNGGTKVANLRIATSETFKDKSGGKQTRTEWHNVVLFGKQAEIAGQYLTKGSTVYIEGRLQTRKWTNKDGQDQYTTEIVSDTMKMLGGKRKDGAPADEPDTATESEGNFEF